MGFTVALESDFFGNEHFKRRKTYCVVMEMEFGTRISTCDLMNWAAAGPGHPSLSPAHEESGPGRTVTFLQDLGHFLPNPVGVTAVVALTCGEHSRV